MSEENYDQPIYRIHPGVGIARLGNSPQDFCISPEKPATLPLECDVQGNPMKSPDGMSDLTIKTFKDAEGRIKRQAARFQLYVYDDENPKGRPLKLGDKIKGGGNNGTLIDIQWQVYLANKKSAWYEFNATAGEHGYTDGHPRRNADITADEARQALIIDPGPQVVNVTNNRSAHFDRGPSDTYAPVFPPPLAPRSIDTLGELKTDDTGRLLVLGGHGNSGSFKDGIGQPRIDTYANNDGWFDDTSDGVVMARLAMFSEEVQRVRYIDVEYPAWVIVGYPRYVPEILDMITANDVFMDVAIREFAYRTDLYGTVGTYSDPQHIDPNDTGALLHWKAGKLDWNPDHRPWFYRDIWTILFRPDEFTYLTNILAASNAPHNQSTRGTFDPSKLSVPPITNKVALEKASTASLEKFRAGDLFLEALEPTLATLDERLKDKLEGNLAAGLVDALYGDKLRDTLRKTVAAFAESVNSFAIRVYGEDGLTGDPSEYLRRWKGVYEAAQDPADPYKIKTSYSKAKEKLDDSIQKVVDGIYAAVKETSIVPEKAMMRALAPRVPFEKIKKKDTPISIEESFELHSKEFRTGKMLDNRFARDIEESTYDPYFAYRNFLYDMLRQQGEENQFRAYGGDPNSRTFNLPLMPLLAGDNPLKNTAPSKFLRLTDYQFYLLRQWAAGKFYNEKTEGWVKNIDPYEPYQDWENRTGRDLDEGVLSNVLGGAFCPGGEIGWIIRNPSLFKEPYRIKADPAFYNFSLTAANASKYGIPPTDYVAYASTDLSQDTDFGTGMQPGDVTKQMALPWQSDFNECTTQDIDVTYEQWNSIDPSSENDTWAKLEQQVWETLWWPAHRPLQVLEVTGRKPDGTPTAFQTLDWARGIPQTNAGDFKMTTEWSKLGFVIRNPYIPESQLDTASPDSKYLCVERTEDEKEL
jgi:hypothetical protein